MKPAIPAAISTSSSDESSIPDQESRWCRKSRTLDGKFARVHRHYCRPPSVAKLNVESNPVLMREALCAMRAVLEILSSPIRFIGMIDALICRR